MKYCCICGKPIDNGTVFCPYCGAEQKSASDAVDYYTSGKKYEPVEQTAGCKPNTMLIGAIIGVGAAALAVILIILFVFGKGDADQITADSAADNALKIQAIAESRTEDKTGITADEASGVSAAQSAEEPAKAYLKTTAKGSLISIAKNKENEDDIISTTVPYRKLPEAPDKEPTRNPTPEPTRNPTPEPTRNPTPEPTRNPTPEPTRNPTPEPTRNPTPEPTRNPTPEPTQDPTPEPTQDPTPEPTQNPTPEPTQDPAPEPTQNAPSESTPAPQPAYNGPAIVFYPVRSDGIKVRFQPTHYSDLVAGLEAGTALYYYGQSDYGYGSDGELHTWYYIQTDYGVSGWVRSDLVSEALHTIYTNGSIRLRAEPCHESALVTTYSGIVYDTGQRGYGYGSDGAEHEWMLVDTPDGIRGWARSDLFIWE